MNFEKFNLFLIKMIRDKKDNKIKSQEKANENFMKAITMNDRLNDFLKRNLENNKNCVDKPKASNTKIPRVILQDQQIQNVRDEYAISTSTNAFNSMNAAAEKNPKILEMYFSDNVKHSQRPNKLKLNMKKMNSAWMMKYRFNHLKLSKPKNTTHAMSEERNCDTMKNVDAKFPMPYLTNDAKVNQNNWMTKNKLSFQSKKPSNSERRPFTDIQEYRDLGQTHSNNFLSQNNEINYQETKKLSKLFK